MGLIDFDKNYPDKLSCKQKFKEYRDQVGFLCSKCGGKDYYWKKDKEQYECKGCKTRTILRSGRVMHKSKLPYRHWFIAMHLLTSTKKTFSAKEIQLQLGHNRYAPIWHMVHKLRLIMGKRDEQYFLAGAIELDEGFFSTEVPQEKKHEKLKRGRGSQKKSKVLVMVESQLIENPKEGKKTKRVGYLKMKVIENLEAKTIDKVVQDSISKKSSINTDDSTSYVNLHGFVESHKSEVIPKELIREKLPWVHIAISNTKRQLLNSYHKIKPKFLQSYLDEFCYKFNRRFFGEALFSRVC